MGQIIVRGTTPTIKYTFDKVNAADIVTAYLTIKQNGELLLEKTLNDADVDTESNTLFWRFTQQETLSIGLGEITVMANWKSQDGTRGASRKISVLIMDNDKDEVI